MATTVAGDPAAVVNLLALVARLFGEPPDDATLRLAAVASAPSGAPANVREAMTRLAAAAATADLVACEVEYTRLFFDPMGAPVRLWESAVTETPSRLMGEAHRSALAFYRSRGVQPRADNEPADHISLELGFIAALLSDSTTRETLDAFVARHAGWMATLAEQVDQHARENLYRAAAALLRAIKDWNFGITVPTEKSE